MSDIDTGGLSAADTTEIAPADSGQVDVGAESTAVGSEGFDSFDPDEFFDISSHADKKVRVKVAGEEVVVPVAELANGYQRQSDYTRKTQQLAADREQAAFALQLQQALEVNPEETLRLLSTAYGVNLTPAQAAAVAEAAADTGADTFIDPVEQVVNERFGDLDARLRQFEVAQAQAEIARTVDSLKQKYGDSFNEEAVIRTAVQWGEPDLEKVFKLIAFDTLIAGQQAVAEFAQSRGAEDAARMAAKADLAGVVSGGASSAAAAEQAAPRTNSVAEAYHAARRELGLS